MPSEDTATAPSTRAQELRVDLTARLDAETMLVQAGQARKAAVGDADALLAEAQQISEQPLSESRRQAQVGLDRSQEQAGRLVAQARADAEEVRALGEEEVETHRRQVRDEVTARASQEVLDQAGSELIAVREQSAAMIGDLEASVRILAVALETAQADVGEMLSALGELRIHTVEGFGHPVTGEGSSRAQPAAETPEAATAGGAAPRTDIAPPRTALEAYLRSSHLDHGDPALPAVDDTEVGLRYAQEAERGRRGSDAVAVATGRPGCWAVADGSGRRPPTGPALPARALTPPGPGPAARPPMR